ncbi:MAG: FmdB family zinc ribbon protein [Bacillota bacterium]|jgi:putative FmdB family regulatory protein
MPTYDYECHKCGRFEVFQRITEEPLKVCPQCGSEEIRRLISGHANIIFVGSGFYSTDNRHDKPVAKASGDSGSK